MTTNESKIMDLEIKTTYLEKSIDDLNKVIIEQQKQLSALKNKLADVEDRIKSGESGEIINPPPPHH